MAGSAACKEASQPLGLSSSAPTVASATCTHTRARVRQGPRGPGCDRGLQRGRGVRERAPGPGCNRGRPRPSFRGVRGDTPLLRGFSGSARPDRAPRRLAGAGAALVGKVRSSRCPSPPATGAPALGSPRSAFPAPLVRSGPTRTRRPHSTRPRSANTGPRGPLGLGPTRRPQNGQQRGTRLPEGPGLATPRRGALPGTDHFRRREPMRLRAGAFPPASGLRRAPASTCARGPRGPAAPPVPARPPD